jgi:hypothetical protein
MPLPTEYNVGVVEGAYVDLTGKPMVGKVEFTASVPVLVAATSKIVIVPVRLSAELDANGHFSVQLPSSSDEDISPTGWTYQVKETFTGFSRSYSVEVPVGQTINISTVVLAVPSPGATITRGPQGEVGPEGQQGPQGPEGPLGPKGDTGATGPEGPQGLRGLVGDQGPKGDTGDVGPQGVQGAQGTGVTILGAVPNPGALPATGSPGDAYLIAGALYVWSGITTSWVNVGNIQGPAGPQGIQGPLGPKGDQGVEGPTGSVGPVGPVGAAGVAGPTGATGPTGPSGTITSATASTLAPAVPASVSLGGTPQARTVDFGIPKGDTGATGPAGPTGPQGPQGTVIGPTTDLAPRSIQLPGMDISLTATAAPLAIGTFANGAQLILDNNELFARIWNAATSAYDASPWALNASFVSVSSPATNVADLRLSGGQATRTDNAARRDFVETLRGEATPPYATGWALWGDGVYRDLRFFLFRDGWVGVSGLCKLTTLTGATAKICGVSGSYVPRNAVGDIVPCVVDDVPRVMNVQVDGLYLRGALPAVGKYVSVSASYPGVTAAVGAA